MKSSEQILNMPKNWIRDLLDRVTSSLQRLIILARNVLQQKGLTEFPISQRTELNWTAADLASADHVFKGKTREKERAVLEPPLSCA